MEAAGRDVVPDLRAVERDGQSARTAGPAISPVEASTPDGRSTATTGAPARVHASIARPPRPRPALETGAEQRVDDHVGSLELVRLLGVAPRLAQDAHRDPPVASVRSAAANGGDPARVRIAAQHLLGDRATRAFHQRVDVVTRLGRPHLLGGVERLEHRRRRRRRSRPRARASASSRGRSRRSRAARPRGLRPAREPDARLRPPDDLDLLPREADADAERLADRLLAGEAAGVALGRIRARVAVGLLRLGEAALAEARVALERPL